MAAGDPAAIEAFYRQSFDLMYREARRCSGGDEATGLDLVQEAMLKVLRSIRTIETPEELEAWTRRLVRSVALDHLRASSRRLRRECHSGRQATAESPPDQYELTQARIVWLEEQLAALEPSAGELLRMRYLWGWTLQRIGGVLGLKPGAVDGRIRRLVTQLQEQAETRVHE